MIYNLLTQAFNYSLHCVEHRIDFEEAPCSETT